MASAMSVDTLGDPGPSSTERRLALHAAAALKDDLTETLSSAKVRDVNPTTYNPSSLHPLFLSQASLRSSLDSTRSSLGALKRSLITFDASVLSPALTTTGEAQSAGSKATQRDPKLSKLFSLLRESAESASGTLAARHEIRTATALVSPNKSSKRPSCHHRERIYLPPALLAPLPSDPTASEPKALRILSIVQDVAKSFGLVTHFEAPTHCLTLAGAVMVIDLEADPSTGAVSKVKFSYSLGAENSQSEPCPDALVEKRLLDLVQKIALPLDSETEQVRSEKEASLQWDLQELAAALKELTRLDGIADANGHENGGSNGRSDKVAAMRSLIAEIDNSDDADTSLLPVATLPSASTLSLSFICHRPASCSLSRPLPDPLTSPFDPSLLTEAILLTVLPSSDAPYLAMLDPPLPCSRQTATELRKIGGWGEVERMEADGTNGQARRMNGAGAMGDGCLEGLLIAQEVGPIPNGAWRQDAFSQTFHCPTRPDVSLPPSFLVSSVPFATLAQLRQIFQIVRSQATLNELFASCFNARTRVKPVERDLFSPEDGRPAAITLDSLLSDGPSDAVSVDVLLDPPSTISATFACPSSPAHRAPLITLTITTSDPDALVSKIEVSSDPAGRELEGLLKEKGAVERVGRVVRKVRNLPLAIKAVCDLLPRPPTPTPAPAVASAPADQVPVIDPPMSQADEPMTEPLASGSVSPRTTAAPALKPSRPSPTSRKSSGVPMVVIPPLPASVARRSPRPKINRHDSGGSTDGRGTLSPDSAAGGGKSREGSAGAEDGEGNGVRRSKRARR